MRHLGLFGRNARLRLSVLVLLFGVLVSCSPTADAPRPDPAARLQAIPPPAAEKYRNAAKKNWQNPYLIVRRDGIGLVDLANNEIHILKPDEVAAALAALPSSAWPYGRVVAIEEPQAGSDQEKSQIRTNRALLAGTLESMKVAIQWLR